MGRLQGLAEHLDGFYEISIFDQAADFKKQWVFHLHGDCIKNAIIKRNKTYDLTLETQTHGDREIPKTHVKLLYHSDAANLVTPLIKADKKVKRLNLYEYFLTCIPHTIFVDKYTCSTIFFDLQDVLFYTPNK